MKDWYQFYGLTNRNTQSKSEKEIERQIALHDIIRIAHGVVGNLNTLQKLYK